MLSVAAKRFSSEAVKGSGPLYRQIAQVLRADIEAGIYPDGGTFPSETTLRHLFGVSRVTIRSALGLLQKEGLIERRRGSGTVVRNRTIHKILGKLVDFHHEAALLNREARSEVLSITTRPGSARERLALQLGRGELVVELKWLRYLDNVPVIHRVSAHPLDVMAGVTPAELKDGSLYAFLRRKRGINVQGGDEMIEPAIVDPEAARLLLIPPGTAVWRTHRIATDQTGRPVECCTHLIRPDYYKCSFRLRPAELTY
jgi:GntR family transcriptional regulator